jgi:hypothetical protein
MKVRLFLDPNKIWWVQSKRWWHFNWQNKACFSHDNAHERAHSFARLLISPHFEEIK